MTLAQLLTLLYDRKLPQGYQSINLTVKLGSKVISDPGLSKTDSFKRLRTEKGTRNTQLYSTVQYVKIIFQSAKVLLLLTQDGKLSVFQNMLGAQLLSNETIKNYRPTPLMSVNFIGTLNKLSCSVVVHFCSWLPFQAEHFSETAICNKQQTDT